MKAAIISILASLMTAHVHPPLTIKQKCERLVGQSIVERHDGKFMPHWVGTPWLQEAGVRTCTEWWYNPGWLGPLAQDPGYPGMKAMACVYDHVAYVRLHRESLTGDGKLRGRDLPGDCLHP